MTPEQSKLTFLALYGNSGALAFAITDFSQPTQPLLLMQNNPNAAAIQAAANTWDWTGATLPDPLAFQLAVVEDPTIPILTLIEFTKFAGVLAQTTLQTMPVLQSLWAAAKAADPLFQGLCTDGTPIVTKIEAYATQFNCPLVPASQ